MIKIMIIILIMILVILITGASCSIKFPVFLNVELLDTVLGALVNYRCYYFTVLIFIIISLFLLFICLRNC